jgi:hypothetical protein
MPGLRTGLPRLCSWPSMRMPKHPARWMLTILFVTLVGLALWIVWAVGKLEKRKPAKLPPPAAKTP